VIYATTPEFLSHFGLDSRRDLPGIDELKAAGLLDPVDEALNNLDVDGPAEKNEATAGEEEHEADAHEG
jgi:segregation and condensation protein B